MSENVTTLSETRESKRALQIKTEVMGLLSDVTDVMNRAVAEGFDVSFSVVKGEKGEYFINSDLCKVTKSW